MKVKIIFAILTIGASLVLPSSSVADSCYNKYTNAINSCSTNATNQNVADYEIYTNAYDIDESNYLAGVAEDHNTATNAVAQALSNMDNELTNCLTANYNTDGTYDPTSVEDAFEQASR